MNETKTTAQKVGAVLLVFFLFLFVAAFFAIVGRYNHNSTIKLQTDVRKARAEALLEAKFSQVKFLTTDFSGVSAKSFITLLYSPGGKIKVLAERNSTTLLPIASISKLFTAIVMDDEEILKVSLFADKDYVGGDGTFNILKLGESYLSHELFKSMLIASDNDSARLLSSFWGTDKTVTLMNEKAKEIGLTNTSLYNVTGLDPLLESEKGKVNISTADDLSKLMMYLVSRKKNILEITRMNEYEFCDDRENCRLINNTNKLLSNPNFPFKIIGGKTGQTDLALRNLALITEPISGIFLINIVLGSTDHFADTEKILNQITVK
jgi:D-alanyl-D-alanine carboxypeptidase (penicillin-binding protein 5/6)